MSGLVRYETARKALAEAHSVDEVKEIHDEAAAMQAYARQAKDMQLLKWSTEIRGRAVFNLGTKMEAQKAAGLLPQGRPKNGSAMDPFSKPITLEEAGIDKHLADKARKFAARTPEEFEIFLAKSVQKVCDEVEGRKANRTSFTADNEWFTPPEYVELARCVLGEIDLDPASHRVAQKTIQAESFFTSSQDGLAQDWSGRVWLNPPYAQPAIGHFVEKLVSEVETGRVTAAILLTHNYTDTSWFHKAAMAAQVICFTRGRIRFVALDGGIAAPTQGQVFFYFGDDAACFASVFGEVGLVLPKFAERAP